MSKALSLGLTDREAYKSPTAEPGGAEAGDTAGTRKGEGKRGLAPRSPESFGSMATRGLLVFRQDLPHIRSAIVQPVDAAVVIRAARRRAGLSQAELARRGATTQSAVAAYESGAKEPSMAVLNRLVAAAGCSVAWALAPADSPVTTTVESIANALRRADESAALRLAADLFTRLSSAPPPDVAAAIEHDPGSTGDQRWDALVAGLSERAAHAAEVRTPVWTAAASRFLDRWWFLTPYRSLHASVLIDTPAELANRGVFVEEASLRSV